MNTREKACTSKSAFFTEKAADKAVAKAAKRGTALRYYTCPYCTHFHLTKKNVRPLNASILAPFKVSA